MTKQEILDRLRHLGVGGYSNGNTKAELEAALRKAEKAARERATIRHKGV